MLPVVAGDRAAARVILAHTIMLVVISLMPLYWGAGIIYVTGALIGGVLFLRTSVQLLAEPGPKTAMRNFRASLLQLGQIRYRQGRMDEARRLVARHSKLVAPSAESLWLALRIERRMGQRVAEQSFANQLRRRFPGSPEYQALQKGKFD